MCIDAHLAHVVVEILDHSPKFLDSLPVREWQNSPQINENMVSHFPVKAYNGVDDLVKTIMTPLIAALPE